MSQPRAKPVVGELVRRFGDRTLEAAMGVSQIGVPSMLVRAIRNSGPDAIPLLAKSFANRRIATLERFPAAQALALFGRAARLARDAILRR